MRHEHLKRTVTLALLGLMGCSAGVGGSGYPEARPLGRDLEVYRAPPRPSEAAVGSGVDEPTGDIVLADVLRLALLGNAELAAFSWSVRASDARALQAAQVPNPEMEVELEHFGGAGELAGFQAAEAKLVLSQVFEIGGKRGKRTKVALLERDLSGWEYEAKRLDVLADAAVAFVRVLANQERLVVAEESAEVARRVLEVVSERVKAGKVSPLEETRAGVELAAIEIEVERIRNAHQASRMRLGAAWGSSEPVFGKATGDFYRVDDLPSSDALLGRAHEAPEIARWSTEMEMYEAAIEMQKAVRIPDVELSGGVKRELENRWDSYVLSVGIPIPLFDRNRGGIREAECNLARGREGRKAAEVAISADLFETYHILSASHKEAVSLASTVLPAAERALEATGEGYRQGKFGYLDVLDAQRTLFEVKAQYIDALESYHESVMRVERIIGCELGDASRDETGGGR